MIWYRILELEMRLKEIVSISNGFNGFNDGRKRRASSDATQAWACSEGTIGNINLECSRKLVFVNIVE